MDTRALIEIMEVTGRLKDMTRHSWTAKGNQESVADHSWHLALFAFFVKDEFPEADMDKVIRMCLFHDIGEAFTGDIPSFYKTEADEAEESRQIYAWVDSLPEAYREEIRALYQEMDRMETLEAKIYKALDKMEVVMQHNEADLSSWIPLEYTENLVYGQEQTAFSPYFQELRKTLREDSQKKLDENQKF